MRFSKTAILVVLYNEMPPEYIRNYHCCYVILVDNTPDRNLNVSGNSIYYIPLMKNFGIAYALNVGFQKAKSLGVEWVLTMDQDSDLPSDMISKYHEVVSMQLERFGLLCPKMNIYKGQGNKPNNSIEVVDYALTSGSFVSMKAYEEVGGFKNELFIDSVDFEFCLNLRAHGYLLYRVGNVLMQHQLGNTHEYKLFGRHLFYITNHNYIRHYYMTRNNLYIHYKYPQYFKNKSGKPSWKTIIKLVLFEKDVTRKLKAIKLGIKDFHDHRFGEFTHII